MSFKTKIPKFLLFVNIITAFILSVFFAIVYKLTDLKFETSYIFYFEIICGVYAIFSILCFFSNEFYYILPFISATFLAFCDCLPYCKIEILIAIPVIQSLYIKNKKFTIAIMLFQVLIHTLFFCLVKKPEPSHIFVCILTFAIEFFIFALYMFKIFSKNNNFFTIFDTKRNYEEINPEDTINTIFDAVFYHNETLLNHSLNVAYYSKLILQELAKKSDYEQLITDKYIAHVEKAAKLHDLGKLYIKDYIIEKKGSLNYEEFQMIKEHCQKGLELFNKFPLKNISDYEFRIISNVIIQHHEKLDCSGYPNNLSGDEISFEAQVVAVADCLDAALSFRIYKKGKTFDEVYNEFKTFFAKSLNQNIVDVLPAIKHEIQTRADKVNESIHQIYNY